MTTWRWQHHETIRSTQDLALEAARANDPGHLAILADLQTAGRGSRGRAWTAPPGNLNLSLLLRPPPAPPGRWPLLAGLALHTALAPYAPDLMLKWPNDLLLNGAKLAGILIDSEATPSGHLSWLVIGLGANLAAAPHIKGRPTASLPPPAPAARAIAEAITQTFDAYEHAPMAAIVEAWRACAHPIGTELDVLTPQRRITGRFAGLSPNGELLLEGEALAISSAEVFFFEKKNQKTFITGASVA
jgi:BirA family biotin operon repressor/biotin-[acetyl-CoA-carboxylase] ligase